MANKRNSRSGKSRSSSSRRMTKAEQEQKAKKEQRQKTARTVAIVLLVILLLAILGFAGFGIAYLVTDGFGGRVPTAVIMIDDEVYSDSADGLTIYPGDEVRVQSLTGDAEYTMKIEGNASTKNFAFTLGSEPYTWRDMDGEDMTAGFTITQTGTGFTIDYDSLPSIITAARGAEAVIEDADLSGDLFTLVVTVGEREYRFGFGLSSENEIAIVGSDMLLSQTEFRGEYYVVGTDCEYRFDLVSEGDHHDYSITVSGVGSAYFGSRYENDAAYYYYEDVRQIELSEIADQFIVSATITDNALTIVTGDKILEEYYSSYMVDENFYDYAADAYVVELDDAYEIKDVSDTFSNPQAQANAEALKSSYFVVTVQDNVSGARGTVRLWLEQTELGIVLDPDQIIITDPDGALQPETPEEPTEEPETPTDDPTEQPEDPDQFETMAEKEEAMIRYMVQAARAQSYEELEPIMGTIHQLYTDIVSSDESSGNTDVRTALSAYVTLFRAVEDRVYTEDEAAAIQEDLGDLMERY